MQVFDLANMENRGVDIVTVLVERANEVIGTPESALITRTLLGVTGDPILMCLTIAALLRVLGDRIDGADEMEADLVKMMQAGLESDEAREAGHSA